MTKPKSDASAKDSSARKSQEGATKDLINKANPSANLMKKAIDATSKNDPKQGNRGKGSSSYVKTDKDGKKVINLHRPSQPEVKEHDLKDPDSKAVPTTEESKHIKQGTSSVFDRLNKQGIHHIHLTILIS